MDAITLLKADHRAVEDLLKQVQDLSESAHAQRRALFQQLDKELTVHSRIEETIFYPALKQKAKSKEDNDATQEVLEAIRRAWQREKHVGKIGRHGRRG